MCTEVANEETVAKGWVK